MTQRPDIYTPNPKGEALDHDSDERLSSGMKVSEAVTRASAWWERKGRKMMRQQRLKGSRNAGFFNVTDPDNPNFIPSSIVAGKPWDALTKTEKLAVVKAWHWHYVQAPAIKRTIRYP